MKTTGLFVVALGATGFAAASAQATLQDIINVTGANDAIITTTPPNPVTSNPNDSILLAWDERQNVTLQNDLRVDRVFNPGASFVEPDGSGFIIKAGTVVSSHYLQWDAPFGGNSDVTATIQLDSQVFAFITADQKLFDSDSILGLPGLDYNDFTNRGLEVEDTTEFNGTDVDIAWGATTPGDWTRLLTAFSPTAAPELTTDAVPGVATTLDFGTIRVGTTTTADITITNTGGEQPAGLTGTVPTPGAGPFSLDDPDAFGPLTEDTSTTKTYRYSPTARGADNAGIGSIDTNDVDGTADLDAPITLSGNAVGPVAAFDFGGPVNPGNTLDLGVVDADSMVTLALDISNITTDADGGNASLTDLTLLGFQIDGTDAAKFSLVGFTPGTVVSKGDSVELMIKFDPADMLGLFDDATLTLLTDQDAALGGNGESFSFALQGESVPEPTGLTLLGLGGATLLLRRRRA